MNSAGVEHPPGILFRACLSDGKMKLLVYVNDPYVVWISLKAGISSSLNDTYNIYAVASGVLIAVPI